MKIIALIGQAFESSNADSARKISGKLLIHRRSAEDEETDNQADISPKFVYIMPFVYSSASLAVLPLVILLFDLGLI